LHPFFFRKKYKLTEKKAFEDNYLSILTSIIVEPSPIYFSILFPFFSSAEIGPKRYWHSWNTNEKITHPE